MLFNGPPNLTASHLTVLKPVVIMWTSSSNNKATFHFVHRTYFCFVWLSQHTAITSLNGIDQLIFVMVKFCCCCCSCSCCCCCGTERILCEYYSRWNCSFFADSIPNFGDILTYILTNTYTGFYKKCHIEIIDKACLLHTCEGNLTGFSHSLTGLDTSGLHSKVSVPSAIAMLFFLVFLWH